MGSEKKSDPPLILFGSSPPPVVVAPQPTLARLKLALLGCSFAMQSANKNEPTPEEVAPASVTEKATTAAAYTVRVHN